MSTLAFNKTPSSSWNLMLRAPLLSFQLALEHQFPKTNVNGLTPEEFKHLLKNHLQNSIVINTDNGRRISMDSIAIALGHEVLIIAKLDSTVAFSSIQSISNHFFSTLNDHFSILSIELDGKEMMKTVLNKENKFTAQINGVKVAKLAKSAENRYGQIALYAFLIIVVIAFFYIFLLGPTPKKK
ncbi:MAG: hypothetical protein K9I92_07750 [Chitinophagaceae bacterium]|nr:hypothetical protein [Chitinophagaceae bacterium]